MKQFVAEDGGVVRAVLDMCAALAAHGHEVTLLSMNLRDVPSDWKGHAGDNLPHPVALNRGWNKLLSPDSRQTAQWLFHEADLVHLHVPWDPICLQLGKLAARERVPYVLTPHGMLDEWSVAGKSLKKKLYWSLGARTLLRRAAAVHCTSTAELQQSEKWFAPAAGMVAPLFFDASEYSQLQSTESGSPRMVLFMSRFDHGKGVEILIDAADILRDRRFDFQLVMAGQGAGEPWYERLIEKKLNESKNPMIQTMGFVTGNAKRDLLMKADVFVLPSIHENWGFSILEAMASAKPVIITRGANIWRELQESGGVLVIDRNAAALADAIAELLADPQRQQQMGQRARQWVREKLTVESVVEQYERMYAACMKQYA